MGIFLSKSGSPSKGINISNKLRSSYVFPGAGFTSFPDTGGYIEYKDEREFRSVPEPVSSKPGWTLDYAKFGVSIAIVPSFIPDMHPNRIDLVLPDQTKWPPSLWSKLDARDSVHVRNEDFQGLGIATYLRQALKKWSDGIPDFESFFRGLPFASSIALSTMTEDPNRAQLTVKRAVHGQGSSLLSRSELGQLWGLDDEDLPPEVPHTALSHKHHAAGDVVIVTMGEDRSKRMAFKSSRRAPLNIYHEIKVLLAMPPSHCIIGRPLYLVSVPLEKSGKTGICGFLVELYETGSLEDILAERRLAGTLKLKDQTQWALDLISALRHVQKSPARFYSDLRMDQLVLRIDDDGNYRAVLLDFEQSRNIYNWAPPEIYYLEWIAELGHPDYARSDGISEATMSKYNAILTRYLKSRNYSAGISKKSQYDAPDLGWYWPWISSTSLERESGMVYMLGKALWCLFEGYGDADIVLGRSGREDGLQRFPEFTRTPAPLRPLIRDCTCGAREWTDDGGDGPISIYRRGGKVFPFGKTGRGGEPEGTTEETKDVIRSFWQREMDKAERFVEARMRFDARQTRDDDEALLHYLRRPRLEKVQAMMEKFCLEGLET